MQNVKPKKNLGQHFLKSDAVAKQISSLISEDTENLLEVGPGMGILTQYFIQEKINFKTIDIDSESVDYLQKKFPFYQDRIIEGDFLRLNLSTLFDSSFSVIGNFPYNISSQIMFKIIDNKMMVNEVVGMFQWEVAERIASPPGKKAYGILSVFTQAFYDVTLEMKLNEDDFIPPPKVKSGVIKCILKKNIVLDCDEKFFRTVVKTAFNQRRKMLGNALGSLVNKERRSEMPFSNLRAENLSWQNFVELTNWIAKS